jgi:acyl-CoA thioester hydrolase
MPLSTQHTFSYTFTVPESHADGHGHVNNIHYLAYVIEVATRHWEEIARPEWKDSVTFFVRRHELDYKRAARPGDVLRVTTWVGQPTAATWERFTLITQEATGEVALSARSIWVLIDPMTQRPKRIPSEIREVFFPYTGTSNPSP